jgi:hypothetical protein
LITLETIPYSQNPQAWDRLLASDPVQYPLGYPDDQLYSRAYAANWTYRDHSMIVLDNDIPLAGLQVTLATSPDGKNRIDFYTRPILLRRNGQIDRLSLEKAEKLLADAFLKFHESAGRPPVTILEMADDGCLSDFAVTLLREGAVATPIYKQVIELTHPESELKRDLRKSYKSLITWGEKNLGLEIYDSGNINPGVVEEFRQLHIATAGRETRSEETWKLQYQQIKDGHAYAILGRLEKKLVTAGLFLHSPLFCYYGVSASIREMFDKPLSHAIIWTGILEAKKRGCRLFEMGDLAHLYPQGYDDKEKNIALFKRGFGGKARVMLSIGFPG